MSTDKIIDALKKGVVTVVFEKIDTKETSPKYYLSAIDNLKNKGISPNELNENKYRKNDKEIRKIYSIYQSELLRLNSVDFGDLILFCIKIFQKNNNILFLF